MVTKFKGFEEFGKIAQQERVQSLKQQIDGIFEKSIKDDFDSVPEGPFKSKFPEISWIAFARPINRKTSEKNKDTLNAVIFSKTESGKNINHTWTINRNGEIKPMQEIPPELSKKYSREEIALEIASLLERIGPSFIHLTNLDVIPLQDEGESREIRQGPKGPSTERPIDPEREKFLQSQRGAKFEFANRTIGFKGYKGLVFDRFIYLDNPYRDNAAFIVDLPESVNLDAIEGELSLKKKERGESETVSKKEIRDAVLERYWQPISDKAKTRKELTALGAQRFVHTPETWQENVRQVIESKTVVK